MNQFRRDPVTGRVTIISAARDNRPNQFKADGKMAGNAAASRSRIRQSCQFCRCQFDTPTPIACYLGDGTNDPQSDKWEVCVVPNLYPSLDIPSKLVPFAMPTPFDSVSALGTHDVVIEAPTHVTLPSELTTAQTALMLRAYRDRMLALRDQAGIAYVQVIKNSGAAAGASVQHAHSQIFGMPFTPDNVECELAGSAAYHANTGECVFCEVMRQELDGDKDGSRLVAASPDFVAWCPHASRVGYELHIAPRIHAARFELVNDELLLRLAGMLKSIFRLLDAHPRISAFNYLLHTLPFDRDLQDQYHWHIEILPRIANQAGFEWATGVHINTVSPEQAAEEMREARKRADSQYAPF